MRCVDAVYATSSCLLYFWKKLSSNHMSFGFSYYTKNVKYVCIEIVLTRISCLCENDYLFFSYEYLRNFQKTLILVRLRYFIYHQRLYQLVLFVYINLSILTIKRLQLVQYLHLPIIRTKKSHAKESNNPNKSITLFPQNP